jgi:quercetin dioxygenase-like cupin family protein
MTQTTTQNEGEGRLDTGDFGDRLKFQSDGWQVSNLDDHVQDRGTVLLSRFKDSGVVINCYQPGQADEMHAHPKSEHTFLVWKGQLHVKGVEDGEEMTLGPGDFVQIKAGYYYQLHNPGTEMAVYCQFRTIPANPAKTGRVWFAQSHRGKAEAAKAAAEAASA